MLGYRGNPTWRDMSEYAVHFTKDHEGISAYDAVLSILSSGVLKASGPFGAARGLNALGETQKAVCFSEIPLDRLDRLIERRSHYGLAFKQAFLSRLGGARVWYVDDGGAVAGVLRQMVSKRAIPGMDLQDDYWRLTPFIDFPSDKMSYRFEWEREWRVPEDVKFQPDDVEFLFLPEHLHHAARRFFKDAQTQQRGPDYPCPFLDPLWPDARLQDAFKQAEL